MVLNRTGGNGSFAFVALSVIDESIFDVLGCLTFRTVYSIPLLQMLVRIKEDNKICLKLLRKSLIFFFCMCYAFLIDLDY